MSDMFCFCVSQVQHVHSQLEKVGTPPPSELIQVLQQVLFPTDHGELPIHVSVNEEV